MVRFTKLPKIKTMKKLFTIISLFAAVMTANAQSAVKGNYFTDNWTLGISGGVITPTTNHAFFGSMRPTITMELTKWLTPEYGLAVQGQTAINIDKLGWGKSKTAFDLAQVMLLNKVNLMNAFGGYKGEPRMFEIEAYAGLGYTHFYYNGQEGVDAFSSKLGLNFNVNLGSDNEWQINVKPAITYLLDGNCGRNFALHPMRFDVNRSALELTAGVTYKFLTSNGTHNFVSVKEYDQAEVDGLNARINDLRSKQESMQTAINDLTAKNTQLQNELAATKKALSDCQNTPKTETVYTTINRNLESYITFAQGKSTVDRSQMPNVERVATYMKNHSGSRVEILGYASPEGSAEINAKLSKARAEAVKKILVKTYGISASRIKAEGQGVGNMFKEPDWNRVSICTLND